MHRAHYLGMVRPIDLDREGDTATLLRCNECVTEFAAYPGDYDWMFEGDCIVCEGCGSELVPLEKALGEA